MRNKFGLKVSLGILGLTLSPTIIISHLIPFMALVGRDELVLKSRTGAYIVNEGTR